MVAPTCCKRSDGCRCKAPAVTVAVATLAAAESTLAPAAVLEATAKDGPTLNERIAWLTERGLLSPSKGLSEEQVVQQYDTLSKCALGKAVGEESRVTSFAA